MTNAFDPPPDAVALMWAERAILRVMVRYLDRVDARDADGAAELFTADGQADYLTGRIYEGRDAIAHVLSGILRHFERTSHHLTNHLVEVDLAAGSATAITSVYAVHRLADGDRPWHFWGRHVDRLQRVDGEWLIHDRRLVGVDADPEREGVPRSLFAGHTDLERRS